MSRLDSIFMIFPLEIRTALQHCGLKEGCLEEIRIRVGQPMELLYGVEVWYLNLTEKRLTLDIQQGYCMNIEDIQQMVTFLCRYSPYAFEEEMKGGFVTLEGGHRVGIAGQVRMENGHVADVRYISFLNIRVSKQRRDCAKDIVPHIVWKNNIYNTLIVSPPGIGKTTFLRDAIRILSNGTDYLKGLRISVIDERSEIAACHQGVPQNDVGRRTDVLDRCSKPDGMLMVLRAMSPQVIAVDELGAECDYQAVAQALNCGTRILGTVHADSVGELRDKAIVSRWVDNKTFQRYILLRKLENGNRRFNIYNEGLEQIC